MAKRADIIVDSMKRFVGIEFRCPGCQRWHMTPTRQAPAGQELSHYYRTGASWDWNLSLETPVLGPSVLVRTGHYTHDPAVPGHCYCDYSTRYPDREPMKEKCLICHSFVGCNGAAPGQIIFLNDCTHALAGKTVDLPEIDPPQHKRFSLSDLED